ncbi:MAG: hypothetical protein OEV49_01325 [candidate division Zixibacteria bacterium]|nr:hypothetical protein [candidate division Zixibacteria bacterium]MDH3938625.1 hypothetical protein [candidate division Zixibacteria bacterium]MDH4032811.1 hypothetical protein [candidate division Zixibacteria bacterium]
MKRRYHFDFRDILWAPARALSAKKILVMTLALCLAIICYDLFTYLALAIAGEGPNYVFSTDGFFPFQVFALGSTFAWLVYGIGVILALLALMMGFTAVAAFNIEEARGNRFLHTRQALRFAWQRLPQLFLTELALALFVAFIVLLFFLFGLITRLPVVGEWFYAIFFTLPAFIIAILTVFIIVVFQASWVLTPAVVAADRVRETFTAILETFSTLIRQPVRWLLYTGYSLVAAKLCSFVYAYFCYRSVQFIGWAAGLGGGRQTTDLIKSGLSHLPATSDTVQETFNIFPGIDWGISIGHWARGGGGGDTVGYVMALMLFLIFASIIGYFLSIIATGQARAYIVIRYLKDNYDLTAEPPLFSEEEPVTDK